MQRLRYRYFQVAGVILLMAAGLLSVILVRDLLTPRQPSGTIIIPSGRELYHVDVASGQLETFVLDRPGIRNPHQLALSPDGKWLAFTSADEQVNGRIYIAALDGTQARPLTTGAIDSQPDWSPDGQQIVYTRWISPHSALFRVDVKTGEEHPLTDFANELEPDWSPDGARIVFTTSRDGFQELYTMSPDGSDLRRLTKNESINDLQGVYSPDGSMIAYTTNYSVGDDSGEIWVMNADGSSQRRLTDNNRYDHLPVWSPDGTRIAFTSKRIEGWSRDIFVYDLANDHLRQLTHAPGSSISPHWSPDGEWIAFTYRIEDTKVDLYIMRADGSDARVLLPDFGYRALNGLIWLP